MAPSAALSATNSTSFAGSATRNTPVTTAATGSEPQAHSRETTAAGLPMASRPSRPSQTTSWLPPSIVPFTSRTNAELVKYASNAFLAMKITFINEMADLCEKVGADVQDVSRGIGMDGRIGAKFLHAGPGYGGSCFPKDTLALLKTAEDYDSPTRIVEAVVKVNDSRKRAMGRKVVDALGGAEAARAEPAATLKLGDSSQLSINLMA